MGQTIYAVFYEISFSSQLLDALIFSITGIILLILYRKGKARGRLVLWFTLSYSTGRFLSEYTRGDHAAGMIMGLRLVLFALYPVYLVVSVIPAILALVFSVAGLVF